MDKMRPDPYGQAVTLMVRLKQKAVEKNSGIKI